VKVIAEDSPVDAIGGQDKCVDSDEDGGVTLPPPLEDELRLNTESVLD
jgi:hypothetical protein